MSATQTQTQDATKLPKLTKEAANAVLSREVFEPVFFTKLANDYGIQPQSPAEAEKMLQLAGQLRAAYDMESEKTASHQLSFLDFAQERLTGVMKAAGMEPPRPAGTGFAKEATYQLLTQTPALAEVALQFSDHCIADLAGSLAAN